MNSFFIIFFCYFIICNRRRNDIIECFIIYISSASL
nr:MAG TPA: chitin synthase regulator [Caudoviricetes sp.]